MEKSNVRIFDLVEHGRAKNNTGIFAGTKRDGAWIETAPEDFFRKVRHFALGLHNLGIKRGDKVSLHSENSTEWFIADQAILSLGAINVPIYTTQPGDQILYIIENSEAVAYIYSNEDMYRPFRPHADKVKGLKFISLVSKAEPNHLSLDEIVNEGSKIEEKSPSLFDELRSKVDSGDLATFIYTSGTTGKPKGVMLTHNNITSNVLASLSRIPFDIEQQRGHKVLSYLPLSHVFERVLDYMYFHIGYPVYYIGKLEEIKDDLQHVKPLFFGTVPRLLEKIYTGLRDKIEKSSGAAQKIGMWAMKQADNYDIDNPPRGAQKLKLKIADALVYKKIREGLGGNLSGVISGGAALARHLMNFFTAIGLECHQGYGLSETSPVITVTSKGMIKAGSVGKPIDGVQVKIADDGEILAKGPNIMKGYFKNPEATKEVFTEDGWFMTGDVGKINDDGYLYITDRKKDIFKLSTGKYVAPQHVENTLLNSPYIEQAVVLGAARKFCSALIVPNLDAVSHKLKQQGKSADPSDADYISNVEGIIQAEVDHLNEVLPKWEQIKKFALLDTMFSVETGELTPTLKTKRRVIREKFIHIIESIYKEE